MKRYFGIEFLRLLTSVSVLLYHYRHFFGPYNSYSSNNFFEDKTELPFFSILESFYINGFYGVHVFYTISGFVFAHVYLSIDRKITSKEFFLNRFARLYPLHFATLIIVALLQFLHLTTSNSFQIVMNNDIYHFILNLFFISSWGFEKGHSFNAPIWSVSIEIAIYILFFLLIIYLRKFKLTLVILLSIVFLLLNKLDLNDSLFLECARLFFSGVLVYQIISRFKNMYILSILSIILIVLSFVGNFKIHLFCPSLLLLFASSEDLIKNEKIKTFCKMSGNLTYALYLLHIPTQLLLLFIINSFALPTSIYLETYFFFIFFGIMIIFAHFCFKFYENPLNKKIRNFLMKN
tara:strand:- start:765 stop:1811 length:1047 start_codon:yes stop_codon:yes gene_type:complete